MAKPIIAKPVKEVARLVLVGIPKMSRSRKREIAAWIRRQARELLLLSGDGYSNRFSARLYE